MSPEYIAGIVEILSRHTRYIQNRVADIKEGIMSVCEFPPTVAHIEKLVAKWEQSKPARTVYKKLEATPFPDGYDHNVESRKRFIASLDLKKQFAARPLPPTDYNPFPKLTEAFKNEPQLLRNEAMTFDVLFDASRALAVQGKDVARSILETTIKR